MSVALIAFLALGPIHAASPARFVASAPHVGPFEASMEAHSKLKDVAAKVEFYGKAGGREQKRTLNVSAVKSDILIRIQEPANDQYERVDRTFVLRGNQLIGFDAVANERLERPAPATGERVDRIMNAMGEADEVVAVLIEPQRLATLYENLLLMPGWKDAREGNLTGLSRAAGREDKSPTNAKVLWDSTKLLRTLHMSSPGSELRWRITYAKPTPITFNPPRGARVVAAFTLAEAPPKYASKAAEEAAGRIAKGAGALKSGTVTIEQDGRQKRIAFDTNRFRESDANASWAWDGTTLTVHDRKANRYFRGPARRSDVLDLVVAAGGTVDPFTRSLLLRRVPFRDTLTADLTVRVGGQMNAGGQNVTILRGEGERRRVSLSVRQDGLLTSASTEALDDDKSVLSTSVRNFSYARLGEAHATSEFTVAAPQGVRVEALPAIKRE
jgi:hypothetical protein